MRFAALVLFLSAAIASCGGYDWRTAVRATAATEHGCPRARVEVVSDNDDPIARLVVLDVCGARRVYHDVGGRSAYVWVDTTPASGAAPVVEEAAVPAAPPPPLAPAIEAAIRARIDAARDGILACAGSERAAVLAQHADGGTTIRFSLRGDDTPAVTRCIELAVGDTSAFAVWPRFELLHPIAP